MLQLESRKKMFQSKYKRLWSQICDIPTYFSFLSPGPFTRDRQKDKKEKKSEKSPVEMSALVFCLDTHSAVGMLVARGTSPNVNLASFLVPP